MTQHEKPCSECPFNRQATPGHLGGSEPEEYIGQVNGPFWLPCHSTHDYTQLAERLDENKPQCAGGAIFRSHINRVTPKRHLLVLPADHERVFSTFAEFLAHHKGISAREAVSLLAVIPPAILTRNELLKCYLLAVEGKAKIGIGD